MCKMHIYTNSLASCGYSLSHTRVFYLAACNTLGSLVCYLIR